jgi:hypothetical protein
MMDRAVREEILDMLAHRGFKARLGRVHQMTWTRTFRRFEERGAPTHKAAREGALAVLRSASGKDVARWEEEIIERSVGKGSRQSTRATTARAKRVLDSSKKSPLSMEEQKKLERLRYDVDKARGYSVIDSHLRARARRLGCKC